MLLLLLAAPLLARKLGPHCKAAISSPYNMLPGGGELSAHEASCPLCGFQVLTVTPQSGNAHTVCPSCFRNPPAAALGGRAGGPGSEMRCFSCAAQCPLAGGGAVVRACPYAPPVGTCGGQLLIKRKKATAGGDASSFFASHSAPLPTPGLSLR